MENINQGSAGNRNIAVTSIGIVSPIGIGIKDFWEALSQVRSGVKKIQSFKTDDVGFEYACEIHGFNPENHMEPTHLQYFDRVTKLSLVASTIALKDIEDFSAFGVVLGTAFSGMESTIGFERNGMRNGVDALNPMSIGNTVQNTPANRINIKFKMTNLSETITSGVCSSTDAIGFARQYIINEGRPILCGGAEALSIETFGGPALCDMYVQRFSEKELPVCKPFDRDRSGFIAGEGAAMFVLESPERARQAGREILAEIIGYGSSFDPTFHKKSSFEGAVRSMGIALADAGIGVDEVDFVCASANGSKKEDRKELHALRQVFGTSLKNIPVSSIKSQIGETFGASGAFQLGATIMMQSNNLIIPTYNYEETEQYFRDMLWIPKELLSKKINICMLNAFGGCGHHSTLVIRKVG